MRAASRPATQTRGGSDVLLDAALDVVAESGIDALTVRAVATRAGVSPGTVSYHFDSINELRVKALEYGATQTSEQLEALANELMLGSWDAHGWSRAFAALLAHSLREYRSHHVACIELHLQAARQPELRPAAERVQLAYARVAEIAVRALDVRNPEQTVINLVALVTGLMFREVTTPDVNSEQRISAALENVAALI